MNYWKSEKIQNTYPYLNENKYCDVLVIGGGISGALTAYELAKEGHNVIVLEKNIIGYQDTTNSSGTVVGILPEHKEKKKIEKLYIQALNDIFHIQNERKSSKYIEYTNKYSKKGEILKKRAENSNSNIAVELLKNSHIFNYIVANEYEGLALQINPYEFTCKLFSELDKLERVSIYENTEAIILESKDDVCQTLTKNGFTVTSNIAVICCGVDSFELIDEDDIISNYWLYKTYNVVCRLKTNKNEQVLIDNMVAKDIASDYYISIFDREYAIVSGMSKKVYQKANDKKEMLKDKDIYVKLMQQFKKSLNGIQLTPISCFSSYEIRTRDGLPLIDELPNLPNFYCNIPSGENSIIHIAIGAKLLKDVPNGHYNKCMNMFRVNR